MNLVYPLSAGWAYCTWGDTLCLTITEVERLKGHAAYCGDSLCRVLLYFKERKCNEENVDDCFIGGG